MKICGSILYGDNMSEKLEILGKMISESNKTVFFGGAGVSTESGIPDFRGADGIYSKEAVIPPETILSHRFFKSHTDQFFEFYKNNMIFPDAKPNQAHLALAELERQGRLSTVITQNIDGLHQAAGSKNVLELHGSVHRNHCMKCGKFFDLRYIMSSDGVPKCDVCGGTVKPDVVLYEEPLDERVCGKAIEAIADADMLVVGGTSLSVYPAAGFIRYYRGDKLVIINSSCTPYDSAADLIITEKIAKVFGIFC